MTATTISSTLAGFATSLNYQTIPPEVAANAKLRLLDTVGVCLASIGMPYANAILGHVEEQGGRTESRLFGRDTRLRQRSPCCTTPRLRTATTMTTPTAARSCTLAV